MKKIYFVRHAKSSWDNVALSDKERPLNERGNRDAPIMANFISQKIDFPDAILASPAIRTFTTAKIFAKTFNDIPVQIEEQLYSATELIWFSVLKNLDEQYSSAMIVGHNPEITNVVNALAGENIMNMPTCSIAAINFEIDSWKKILDVEGEMKFHHYPKGI